MDGLLETIGWYGKEFISPDCVHPLLFSDKNKLYKVDPNPTVFNLGFSIDLPQKETLKPLYSAMSKLLKIEESKASVRMMEYRGKLSATMMYDYLPINDVFRRVDDNTLLGLMDFKRMEQPFFFILNRVWLILGLRTLLYKRDRSRQINLNVFKLSAVAEGFFSVFKKSYRLAQS